jgi:hypothetical protein
MEFRSLTRVVMWRVLISLRFDFKFVAIGYFAVSYLLKKPTLFKGLFLSRYPRMWVLVMT